MTELVTFGGTALRLSPPANARLETADHLDVWASGAASNVAVAASRLGTDATWASKMADTPMSRRAIRELRGHGLTTEVTWVEESASRQAITFFEDGSEPREDYVYDDHEGAAIQTAEPAELPMEDIQNAETVFVSGETIALAETIQETAQAILRAASGKSVLGLDHRPSLWSKSEAREVLTDLFPAVDVFVANESEAQSVLKKTGEAPQIAHQVASEYDFETVIITRSERGALVWHDSTIHEKDAVETETVEATGEHDAFTGAFLGKRLAGASVNEALSAGIAAASLTRSIAGPVPTITPAEVERVVGEMGGNGGSGGGLR